jgi:hypothetical protein
MFRLDKGGVERFFRRWVLNVQANVVDVGRRRECPHSLLLCLAHARKQPTSASVVALGAFESAVIGWFDIGF